MSAYVYGWLVDVLDVIIVGGNMLATVSSIAQRKKGKSVNVPKVCNVYTIYVMYISVCISVCVYRLLVCIATAHSTGTVY